MKLVEHSPAKIKPDMTITIFNVKGKQKELDAFSHVKIVIGDKTIIVHGDGRIEER